MRFDNEEFRSMLRERFNEKIGEIVLLIETVLDEKGAVDIMVDVAFSTLQTFLIQGTLAAEREIRHG